MKQNDAVSAFQAKRITLSDKSQRSKNLSRKKFYSPRLLTRKTERKDIPSTAFLRRKQSCDEPSVYKYLSPKKMFNDDQYTFLSDDHMGRSTDRFVGKCTFELDFSRINAQKSEYYMATSRSSHTRNFFEATSYSNHVSVQSRQSNLFAQIEKVKYQQNADKTGLSMETMSQTFQQTEGKKFDGRFSSLVKENGRLRRESERNSKQNNDLKEEFQFLRIKSQEMEEEIEARENQEERVENLFKQQLAQIRSMYEQQSVQLRESLSSKQTIIEKLQNQKTEQEKIIFQLHKNLESISIESSHKDRQIEHLQQGIEQLKQEIQDKQNYSKCLEDVILELNTKIDELRKQNHETNNLLEEKTDQLQMIEFQNQRQSDSLFLYDVEIESLKKSIETLTQINSQLQNQKIHLSSHQQPKEETVLNSLKDQISTLQSLLDLERQHNEKLKKQISYNNVELTFLKKNHYQNQKQTKEIESLKQRNKKLMKKLNQVMEENTELKQTIETINKKVKKQNSMKKFFGPHASDEAPNNQRQKAKFASQRVSIHRTQNDSGSPHLKKYSKFDSDDQLSFKLSPDKK